MYGNGFSGNSATLSKRVDSLYDSVEGSGTNISLREEMDALEYTYQNSINDGSLVERVEKWNVVLMAEFQQVLYKNVSLA